ncbi:MAG TPA: sigma-54 dependent transcriptional regulator [Kofleriaceae bacterium]|nr:sigma-54 dependent transcriptional regulator [Kofleriaceae bacterium]
MPDPAKILVIDDDRAVVDLLVEELAPHYATLGETSPRAGIERAVAGEFDIVITDVEMPELRGTELLGELLERKPGQLVLMITAFGSIELAVQAVRAGACDFVTKPFKIPALLFAIERALRERSMRREIVRLRRELGDDRGNLVAASPAMVKVLEIARRAARSTVSVLITGESGTGKGALARWIHDRSPRAAGPFVHVNCAALPGALVEAELFGVRRGAFTDARESRDGLFVEASHGTLFLDEIAEMPLEVQSKLLQVLESSRVRPVGGGEQPIDVRVIAATNRAIDDAVHAGQFRIDLFFRLNVVRFDMPPLRERAGDIPELVNALLARAARGGAGPIGITDDAMRWLARHDWPGNVRELANVVERAVALTDHDTIVLEDVRDLPQRAAAADPTGDLLASAAESQLPLAEVERGYIRRVLDTCEGNVSRAARILGIDRRTLYRKLA